MRPTNPGTLIGTPAFMAPEQVLGTKVYPATDLYAVGGIAYQMLTGRIPHEAPSAIEVISQKMKFDPVPPRQWVPSIDVDVDNWVMMLLDREPERRPESADDARKMLRRLLEGRTKSEHKGVDHHARSTSPSSRGDVSTAILSSQPPIASSNSPVPRKVGQQTPPPKKSGNQPVHLPPAGGGVVPKRQWAEAKTVLVDPVLAPIPSISDSSVRSTDPLKQPLQVERPGNETVLNSPDIHPVMLPLPSTEPDEGLKRTERVSTIDTAPEGKAAVEASGSSEESGRFAGDGEVAVSGESDVPRSKTPIIVVTIVLVAIIVAALLVLFMR